MAHAEVNSSAEAIRDEWIERLSRLVTDVERWAGSIGWASRRIDKSMKDSVIGPYKAPGLLLQKEFSRLILDPISRESPGSEGLVDLYVMPAFDDIASFSFDQGQWNVHHRLADVEAVATSGDAEARPLTRGTLAEVLDELVRHVP